MTQHKIMKADTIEELATEMAMAMLRGFERVGHIMAMPAGRWGVAMRRVA